MTNSTETYVEGLMEMAQTSERAEGLFPLLRTNWSNLKTKDDAYFSIKKGFDEIFLKLKINGEYKKKVGELELSEEFGALKLTGDEKENTFLVIKYPSISRNYYLSFVLECCSELTPEHNIEDMEKILLKWIKRWKLKGKSSQEVRIGLFGELLCLEYLLTEFDGINWRCWQERTGSSGLHDFIVDTTILEIKTSTSQDARIHIFDSAQFEHDPNLILILINLSNNNGDGRFLNDLIGDIRLLISEDQWDLFDGIMQSLGSPFPEIGKEKFKFEVLKWHQSVVNGPFLQQSDLTNNNRVAHGISYSIFESEISFNGSGDLSSIGDFIN